MRFCVSVLVFALLLPMSLLAQRRCGTVAYEQTLARKNKKRTTENFERWMEGKMKLLPQSPSRNQRTQNTITIPIVVHIIHNGEPIGTGVNISDAQVASQIVVLNNDFNRLNADQINTPDLFLPVAGSFDVNFVLAKQDPDGIPTNGIVRVKGPRDSWTSDDNVLIKAQSYWPAEHYLNVWVTTLTDYFGYAQFPVSALPGLEDSPIERLTDGIVVNYQHFGSVDGGNFPLAPRFDKGRTLTHEMGHFFGLRHIWGDISNCATSTDYVDDTPAQNASTAGCPAHPQMSCNNIKMFQNFLDYSSDACMNIFTQGQVARMNIVATNSPRRRELGNSVGSIEPIPVADDLGIKTIVSPTATTCSGQVIPSIIVRNFGTNEIVSAQFLLKRNNTVIETKNVTLSIGVGAEQQIDFLPVTLTSATLTQFEFSITQTNGIVDGKIANNAKTSITKTPSLAPLPIVETFSIFPSGWTLSNPDSDISWRPSSPNGRTAMLLNFFDYTQKDAVDRLITPLFDLKFHASAFLVFDRAYSQNQNAVGDRLRVLVSDACQFDSGTAEVFNKSDDELATASPTTCAFAPVASDWVTEVIPLNSFIGKSIQLAFEGNNENGKGNNLYISNVRIVTNPITNLKLVKLESPSPVSCTNSAIKFRIRNTGTTTINSLTSAISLGAGTTTKQEFSGLTLLPNAEIVLEATKPQLPLGENQITIEITNPNGVADENTRDNIGSFVVAISDATDRIPLRERFDRNTLQEWTIISPQPQQPKWTKVATNFSQSMAYNSFTNTTAGATSWLVSPTLDLTNNTEASVFFDASYATRANGCDRLQVLASNDCGVTFADILFDKARSELAVTNSENSWRPSTQADWKNIAIDLTNYCGNPNFRMAFVATNDNGNNMHIDNIDFFVSNSASRQKIENPFAVYGGRGAPLKITFNLDERQTIGLQVYNSIGQLALEETFFDVVNQTYSLDLTNRSVGICILRLQINGQNYAQKVYVGN